MSKILKNLFSVKNVVISPDEVRKQICLLGLKLSFYSNKTTMKAQINALKRQNERFIEYFDNVNYIFNSFADASKCKKATGIFREIQLVRKKCLKIILHILENNGIEYWIDFGTLLGALRHKGFIPWDDDIDISITRLSHNKIKEVLNSELKDSGISIRADVENLGCFYRIMDNDYHFSYIDIFTYDIVNSGNYTYSELKEKYVEAKYLYEDKYPKWELWNGNIKVEDTLDYVNEIYKKLGMPVDYENGNYLIRGIESMQKHSRPQCEKISDIFPLKKVQFEDIEAFAPNNIEDYLFNCENGYYGNIWEFPDIRKFRLHPVIKNIVDPSLPGN